jgi:rubredoxin
MGGRYSFTCSRCSYVATVSGGPDRGFLARTETMICRQCHELVDVAVEVRTPRTFPVKWTQKVAQCPRCDGTEWLEIWQNRRCPKCSAEMRQGDLVLLWD